MPINKQALIRYKTIDNCLRNRFRKWTLEDLVEACSEALYEYEGNEKGVSLRTVQLDIQNMRSDKLGYNAPIVVLEKKYYTYEDKNFTITRNPLSLQDMEMLSEVVDVLKQFKGFHYFQELTGMITRIEDKVNKQKNKGRSYIDFEKNELLKGLEFIDPIHKAIAQQQSLDIEYKSFKAKASQRMIVFPYLLKEYRNRWFILGAQKSMSVHILALDRIIQFTESPEPYKFHPEVEGSNYFDDAIGVSKMPGQKTEKITLFISKENAPYIITKPIHPSQKIESENEDGIVFTLDVIWNFELEREILGFGESMKVISPRRLKSKLKSRMQKMLGQYEED